MNTYFYPIIGVLVTVFSVLFLVITLNTSLIEKKTILTKIKDRIKSKKHPFYSMRVSPVMIFIMLLASIGFLYARNQELTDKLELQNKSPVIPTGVYVSPTTAPTITPQKKQNDYQPKNDGSRTGRIVEYYSYCEKKNINVYENELVPYTRKDGKQIYSTKSDIQCYEKDYGKAVNNNQQKTNTDSRRVSFTTTEAMVNGTYYCYEDRVNELTNMESSIKIKMEIAEWCNLSAKSVLDSCTDACGSATNYSACTQPCWDTYGSTCASKYEEVGDSRRQYMDMISTICP